MTIQAITGICPHPQAPVAYANCYCYDAAEFGLIAEPIVHDATEAIVLALAHAGICKANDPPKKVQLQFTDAKADVADFKADSTVLKLTFDKQEDGFSFYAVTLIAPKQAAMNAAMADIISEVFPLAPLCEHLNDYFEQAPATLYVGITTST
jgi:hypothetical protein